MSYNISKMELLPFVTTSNLKYLIKTMSAIKIIVIIHYKQNLSRNDLLKYKMNTRYTFYLTLLRPEMFVKIIEA
jgi:hypothetical protein